MVMPDAQTIALSANGLGTGGNAGTPGGSSGGTAPPAGATSSNGASCARLVFNVPLAMQCVDL